MSSFLYDKIREKWIDFLDENTLDIFLSDRESVLDQYDNLSHEFCDKYGYSKKIEEFAFHGQWFDTLIDIYYQKLENEGWEPNELGMSK